MNPRTFNLLIHHHAVAYVDAGGCLWLPSFIGRWVEALAPHFQSIGLLLYQSETKTPRQDTPITQPNVRLFSLGAPGRMWDRIPRIRRLKRACHEAAQHADGLLIRGVTPRQWLVWNETTLPKTAFLLVGTMRPPAQSVYGRAMARLRQQELTRLARGDTTFLANSPLLVDEIEMHLKREARFVPTNTIRRDEFAPPGVRPLSAVPRLLFCGRVVAEKGIVELLVSLAMLRDARILCHLDVVGPVSPVFEAQLHRLAAERHISEQVTFHGPVAFGPRLFDFYQNAELFVLPTYHEGFPHTLWEAAVHSCPVIVSAVGGIPGLWQHEQQALFIPPQDSRAIAAAITRLLADDALRECLARNAYHLAQEYTVEACAGRLAAALSEVWA